MTTETITLDNGQTLTVAPLTLAQVDALQAAAETGDRKALTTVYMDAANNAGANFDYDSFCAIVPACDTLKIQAAIMRMSGVSPKGKEAAAS